MFYVYMLKSKKDKSHYIGFAPDLKNHIEKLNQGLVQSTKGLRPLVLVYKEDALIREKRLKKFAKDLSSLGLRLKNRLILEG